MTKTKTCLKCGITRARKYFYTEKRTKDGLRSQCKICCDKAGKEYLQIPEKKAAVRKYQKEYRQTPEHKVINRKAHQKFRRTIKGKVAIKAYIQKFLHTVEGLLYYRYCKMDAACNDLDYKGHDCYNSRGIKNKFKS
ncbi:unnamed protein product, partial [marine sediment metagenome]